MKDPAYNHNINAGPVNDNVLIVFTFVILTGMLSESNVSQ